jgi:hypothetical protein
MIIVHHPSNAVFEKNDVKVDEQPNGNVQQPEVGKQLGLIHRMQRIFALQLHRDSSLDHQICTKSTIELYRIVDERHGLLTLHLQAQFPDLMGQTSFVSRFEESGPKASVHGDGCSDNLRRKVGVSHRANLFS